MPPLPTGYTYHDGAYWTDGGHGPYFIDSLGEIHLISSGAPPTPPTVEELPIIDGVPTLGFAVTYTPAVVFGSATFTSRQWLLDGAAIPGEVNPTYTPVLADVGKELSIQEVWTNAGGTVSPTSTPAEIAGGVLPSVTQAPVYSQYPMVGTSQAYTQGTATGTPAPDLTIQWLLDGVAIPGETGATYTPVLGDLGGLLSVRETWTNFTGSASADSEEVLVTPELAAAVDHKYIDRTWGGAEGATYNPADFGYVLADGTTPPAGKIYTTCKAAYDSASGNNHRYYCRRGYFHEPVSGVFFSSFFTRSNTLFSSYGLLEEAAPILEGLVYLSDATGWTPHATIPNAWNYSLAGVTAGNSVTGRLWVGRQNNGILTTERPIGTERRRAANIADLDTTNSSEDAGLWYVTAGSPSVLTMLSRSAEAPPVDWNGIGLDFAGLTAAPSRGLAFRNGASNNRVFDLWIQGTSFRPLAVAEISTDSICDSNAFVKVRVQSFISEGFYLVGASAVRKVTNTYLSDVYARLQGSSLAADAGLVNDFNNADPFAFGSYVENTYGCKLTVTCYNIHTALDTRNTVASIAPKNLYLSDIAVTFQEGATDGRFYGGYADGGYVKNFTVSGAPTKSQWGGKNFEVAYGTVIEMQQNKDPDNQYACFQMAPVGDPTGETTENFSMHDIEFQLSNTPWTKGAIWFESGGNPQPAVDAVEVYNIRAVLANAQGLIVKASSGSFPTPWPNQNIHDSVVVNAALIGNNYSTTNSGSKPPTYTTQPLNGFFGCVDNTVVAA